MDEWIVIDIETPEGKFFKSPIYQEEQVHNAKRNLIDNIVQRCAQYGKLDNPYQIARKTGAMQKDFDYEKGQNVYDQDDSFIDDEEIDKENHAMVIPETELDDYHMCICNLKDFQKSIEYKKRVAILKKHTVESKNKSAKKKNKNKDKMDQVVEKQNHVEQAIQQNTAIQDKEIS
ncbi:unnamed protein product [Paramecium octaurelia]|uniref:Hpc2-related domain-containing protein n=1 Tax=Paramecium octaurelia TaxID=43137 RepID=A0A8S1SG47_PAROT|nr:unnamed protein product [Paramecium octaurelia]